MTDFDLLEGSNGRLFIKLFTGKSNYILELEGGELEELKDRLDEPPTPV